MHQKFLIRTIGYTLDPNTSEDMALVVARELNNLTPEWADSLNTWAAEDNSGIMVELEGAKVDLSAPELMAEIQLYAGHTLPGEIEVEIVD